MRTCNNYIPVTIQDACFSVFDGAKNDLCGVILIP
jgi:hypothetical protein